MDVHKHPHHVTNKKKWDEYLLEFLMLFLAVFLGFVSENLRERQVNNTKEKEYMASMLSDLKRDTLIFNRVIDINKFLIRGEDSALHFLGGNLNNRDSSDMALIYFYKYCITTFQAPITDGTMAQLKNSGDLRLIRNKEVTSKLNSYYSLVAQLEEQASAVKQVVLDNSKQAGKIFSYFSHEQFIDSMDLSEQNATDMRLSDIKQWLSESGEPMLTNDKKDLSPFMFDIAFHMGLVSSYNQMLKTLKDYAAIVMQTIRKNYHMEEK